MPAISFLILAGSVARFCRASAAGACSQVSRPLSAKSVRMLHQKGSVTVYLAT
jgi:hypothetical protein